MCVLWKLCFSRLFEQQKSKEQHLCDKFINVSLLINLIWKKKKKYWPQTSEWQCIQVILNSGVVDIDLHIRHRFQVWLGAVGGRERLLVSSSDSGLVVLSERMCLLWLVFGVKDHLFLQVLPSLQLHALVLPLELLHVVLHEAAYHDPFE